MNARDARNQINADFNNGLISREIATHRHTRISQIGASRKSASLKKSLYKAVAIGE